MLVSILRSGNFFSVITYIMSCLITIFLVLPLHECAHGFVAVKLGDDTPKHQGRLTLNPLAHIDYVGAILLLLVGFGWAKPVQINPRRFKNPKAGMAISALAGPMSNLLAAVAAGLLYNGLLALVLNTGGDTTGVLVYVLMFFQFLIMVNIGIAVFNFIPIPPLDGSKILMGFLPDKVNFWIMQNQMTISIILIVLVFSVGSFILNPIEDWLFDKILLLTHLPFMWAF